MLYICYSHSYTSHKTGVYCIVYLFILKQYTTLTLITVIYCISINRLKGKAIQIKSWSTK